MRAEEIARLLPAVYQDATADSPLLVAILAVMEAMHGPDEAVIASFSSYLDPRRAPDPFVRMLAGWLALGPYLEDEHLVDRRVTISPGPLRDLVAIAARAARLRGTKETILELLTAATGVRGFDLEEYPRDASGRPQPFHIRVTVPAAASNQIELVNRLVAGERPAWVTYELATQGA
jgi:phage tail-like protein